jgi:hypothetical protein
MMYATQSRVSWVDTTTCGEEGGAGCNTRLLLGKLSMLSQHKLFYLEYCR